MNKKVSDNLPGAIFVVLFALVGFVAISTVLAATVTSSVVVGNATPIVSAVLTNGGNPITLTASTTQNVNVTFTVTDANGCGDVFTSGTTTVLLYRSAITSSTCNSTQNPLNCYKVGITANSCVGTSSTATATATIPVYYFAEATDASSSFPAQNWLATVIASDASVAVGTADATGVEVNTLTAFNLTTTTIGYGVVPAGTDTGATNQIVGANNVGNSSTTLQVSASQTLTSGSNIIATSSQKYSSSAFTYSVGGTGLSGTPTTIAGFTITGSTSTAVNGKNTFWGLQVPNGTPTGTYTGASVFTALFQ